MTAVCTTLHIPSHTDCKCVHKFENHAFRESTIAPIPVQMVFHSSPNHCVIAPQFCIIAIIPAIAAATAAMTAIIGSIETFKAPIATEIAAMTGVRAMNAASNAPKIMTKF